MAKVTFIAGEDLYSADVVAVVSGTGLVYKASAGNPSTNGVVGFATHNVAAGSYVLVNKDKPFANLSGLIAGETAYVSYASGAVAPSYEAWFSSIPIDASGIVYLTSVGRGVSSSGVTNEVEPSVAVNLDVIFTSFILEDASGYIASEDGGIISLEG